MKNEEIFVKDPSFAMHLEVGSKLTEYVAFKERTLFPFLKRFLSSYPMMVLTWSAKRRGKCDARINEWDAFKK